MSHVWMIGCRSGNKDASLSVVVRLGSIMGMILFCCPVFLVFVCSGGIDVCGLWVGNCVCVCVCVCVFVLTDLWGHESEYTPDLRGHSYLWGHFWCPHK